MNGDPWANDWRERAGRVVLDPNGPNGEPIPTPLDRRWLWRLEGDLAVMAGSEQLRQLQRDLRQYLSETCEHHYSSTWSGDEVIPAHRQCLWCSAVEWLSDVADGGAA